MLTFFGRRERYCDGVSRRSFLQIGALAAGGLTLPRLLRAEAQAGSRATGKSLINIFLNGGPPHLDMFDMKPAAPKERAREATKPAPVVVPEAVMRLVMWLRTGSRLFAELDGGANAADLAARHGVDLNATDLSHVESFVAGMLAATKAGRAA